MIGANALRSAATGFASATKPGEIGRLETTCSACNMRELCAPCCRLNEHERKAANRLAFSRAHLRRGEHLYRSGDHFSSLFAVRNGFFKSTVLLQDGRRDQVTGFAMTGEIIGMDGIATGCHVCDSVALEESEVCVIPFAGLQQLAQEIPALQRQIHRTMSREIVREHGVMLLLGSMNADQRMAMFLLNLSRRFAAQGYSASEFDMRLTRDEAGSYLGLKLETVSRTLSKFRDERLIEVKQRLIRILNQAGLERTLRRVQG
jgi:CRP/FNR family transcriptional regulator, anaerobic regulatory protein